MIHAIKFLMVVLLYVMATPITGCCLIYSLFMWNIKGIEMGEKIYDMCWSLVYE